MKQINLIPAKRRDAAKTSRRVRRWVCACTSYAAAIVVAFIVLRFCRDDSSILAGELSRLAQASIETEQAIATVKPQVEEKQALLQAATAVADQPDWSVLLVLLGKTVGDDVSLNFCQVEPQVEKPASKLALPPAAVAAQQAKALPGQGKVFVRLGGVALSQKSVSQFVLRLEQTGLFDRVQLIKSDRQSPSGGQSVNFRVECTINGQGRSS